MAVLKLLIEAGAEVDRADEHCITPLMSAAEMGHDAAVSVLLAAGENDVEYTTDDGRTALKLAMRLPMNEDGHKRTVALLGVTQSADLAACLKHEAVFVNILQARGVYAHTRIRTGGLRQPCRKTGGKATTEK
eukprot:CAMPEP_0198683514 /NCGR_PEP_ID=MMETSP1468-20131203/10760_1 /TAXON_ID=1461545 /ORGANISM="Mantoniella sp, Strain CCMP1436" /LENGTH=132 /DNA_ID=CAMNT_0044427589 /DNA_START=365 /DNA_END=765 /DNA_ORIENTATION=-